MPVQTAPGHRVFGRGFFFGVTVPCGSFTFFGTMYRDWFDRMDETMRKPAAKQRHDVAPCASMGIGVERPILVFSVLHRRRTAAMKDGKNEDWSFNADPHACAWGYIVSLLRSWFSHRFIHSIKPISIHCAKKRKRATRNRHTKKEPPAKYPMAGGGLHWHVMRPDNDSV